MPRFHIFDPPEPMDRPVCSNFGWTMWIARTEPDEPGHDKRTVEHRGREDQETKPVKHE